MIIYLFSVVAAIGLSGLAGWCDFKGMTIPNQIVVAVLVAFFTAYGVAYLSDTDIFASLKSHLAAGGIVFIATFLMFVTKLIGGGDAKLITAFSFWTGLGHLLVFLTYMIFSGAILGFVALVIKKVKPFRRAAEGSWIYRLQNGEGLVPYGIPIAIGALVAFVEMDLLALENLKLFLMPN